MRELKREEEKDIGGGAVPEELAPFGADLESKPDPIIDFNPPVDLA
jgi:hypothetical protein